MLILELLKYAAAEPASEESAERVAEAIESASEREFQWALNAGLGPQLHVATKKTGSATKTARDHVLLASYLTEKVHHSCRTEAAIDILDICESVGAPATLLKGISVSEQFYPEACLRAMTDVDILIPAESARDVEVEALRLGYRQGTPIMGVDPHHREPLYHPSWHTKIEIHTALFQKDTRLREGTLFSPSNVEQQLVSARYQGRAVNRLSCEMQLVYIASYFSQDLSRNSIHPSLVTPLIDITRLLQVCGQEIDWPLLLSLIDNELAMASLSIMLDYLARHGLGALPANIVRETRLRQNIVAAPETRLIETLLDNYLVAGRTFPYFNSWHIWLNLLAHGSHTGKIFLLPWRIAFPPSYPDRYDLRFQCVRLTNWLRNSPRK